MQNFKGVIKVSLETKYNKSSLVATFATGGKDLPKGRLVVAYDNKQGFKQNTIQAARMLAACNGLASQDYQANFLECQEMALFTACNSEHLTKVSF